MILFIISLILVSGFVAYFGDLLGRRMGKKRLTLFGLRPRHTAIIVTTITGMLISALAIAALVYRDARFRKILIEGDRILTQNQRLSRANVGLDRKNTALVARRGELEKLVALRQKELEEARVDAARAKKVTDELTRRVESLRNEVNRRKNELHSVRAELAGARAELHVAQADVSRAEAKVVLAQAGLAEANSKLARAQGNLEEAQKRLAYTADLLQVKTKRLEETTAQLRELETAKSEFEIQSAVARSREFIVRQGDELLRGTISPRQSEFGLRGELFSILDSASAKAAKLGAKVGDNGRAVTVVFRQKVRDPKTDQEYIVLLVNEPQYIEEAIRTIASSSVDVVVQLVCAHSTLPSEQVPVEIRLWINKLVYTEGQKVADIKIDGRMSEGRILVSLLSFLQNEVAKSAVHAGIIPASNPDPRESLGQSPEEQVDELMDVVDRVRAANGPSTVTVHATDDIYASGTLNVRNIRFDVAGAQ